MACSGQGLPAWLQKELEHALESAAPGVFEKALQWVFSKQQKHLLASPAQPLVEINAIARGLCSEAGGSCDVEAWTTKLQTLNMLPELIRMTCSMIGAWGSATEDGQLLQLRTLDFGGAPSHSPSARAWLWSQLHAGGQAARSPTG